MKAALLHTVNKVHLQRVVAGVEFVGKVMGAYTVLSPRFVHAQTINTLDGLKTKLCTVGDWLYTFAFIIAIIYVIIAAIKYTTAGGGEKVSEANKALLYAVIGVAVAIIAKSVPQLVASILGVVSPSPCP